MTKPLLVILLLLPLSISAGELDGKGIFCESNQEIPRGYTFNFGIVMGDLPQVIGLEVHVKKEGLEYPMEYREFARKVQWSQPTVIYTLNRQSLQLQAEEISADGKSVTTKFWQCKSYQDIKKYEARLDEAVSEIQASLKRDMTDNKI